MTTRHDPTNTRINTSFILNDYVRKEDGKQQLKAATRIYHNSVLIARFTFLVDMGNHPVMLFRKELKKGVVGLDSPQALQINQLIKSIKVEIDAMATAQIRKSGGIDIEKFKKEIKRFCTEYKGGQFTVERVYADPEVVKPAFIGHKPIQIDQAVLDKVQSEEIVDADTGEPIGWEDVEDVLIHEQNRFEQRLEQAEVATIPTEQRFRRGLWNKENIFELFASTYYLDITNEWYSKIVISMFRYREHVKPREHVNYLGLEWATNFFKFLNDEGKYVVNTKTFDPFKYDRSIFFKDKGEKEPYSDSYLNKLINIFKQVIRQLHKQGYIKRTIDLTDLKLTSIRKGKLALAGTRIDHHLTKQELDEMLFYKFDPKKIKEYQKTFDNLTDKGIALTINTEFRKISIEKMNRYRDVFCFMTMAGGQRGINEYNSTQLLKYTKTELKLVFWQNKVENVVENPNNEYTKIIIERHGRSLPKIESAAEYEEYRAYLKVIAHVIGLDRQVQEKKNSNRFVKISDILNPYMCRKTFGTVLAEELGLADEQIALFTGHKDRTQSELSSSYINRNNIEFKKKLIAKLKPKGRKA